MAESALQPLQDAMPLALAKAVDNICLCQFFMGILGKTVWEADQRGYDIFKVDIGEPMVAGQTIRAKVSFERGASPDLNFMDRVDGVKEFIGKKSAYMGKVVEMNPTYMRFLHRMVEKLETYALRRGLPFGDLEIRHGFMTNDDWIVLEMVQ